MRLAQLDDIQQLGFLNDDDLLALTKEVVSLQEQDRQENALYFKFKLILP